MQASAFRTEEGLAVPAVTADQMREVDRVAMEEFSLGILQMMENAGRNLAEQAFAMMNGGRGEVAVLAGSGGNSGGGLCCARHLHNRGFAVSLILDRPAASLTGAAGTQLRILHAAGLREITGDDGVPGILRRSAIVVDALIGYGLRGAPRGRTAELIDRCNEHANRVLALDLPSGLDATTGAMPGSVVRAERTLTLALPKTGLAKVPGELYVADIGIPPEVYRRIGLSFATPFRHQYWTRLYA